MSDGERRRRPAVGLILLGLAALLALPAMLRARLDSEPLPPAVFDLANLEAEQRYTFSTVSGQRYIAWLGLKGVSQGDPRPDWLHRRTAGGRADDDGPIEAHLAVGSSERAVLLQPGRPHTVFYDAERGVQLVQLGRWQDEVAGPCTLSVRLSQPLEGLPPGVAGEVTVQLDTYSWLHTSQGLLTTLAALGSLGCLALAGVAFAWVYGSRRWRARGAPDADDPESTG
jgi:hypothetical protein